MLYGGEDFELVLCMNPESAAEFCAITGSHKIGMVTEDLEVRIVNLPGGEEERVLAIDRGFQHFPQSNDRR